MNMSLDGAGNRGWNIRMKIQVGVLTNQFTPLPHKLVYHNSMTSLALLSHSLIVASRAGVCV